MESCAAERGAPDGLCARDASVADGSCGLGGGERGRRLPSAVRHHRGSEPLGSLSPPWFFFAVGKKKKGFLSTSCISRRETGEERWSKCVEGKAIGWVFHLKLILPLSTVLIVNRWKLLLSGAKAKKRRGRRRGI